MKKPLTTNQALPPYVIIRAVNAGVFAGYLQSKDGSEVVLTEARRIWYWAGAATLSQLAEEGTSQPGNCKFPQPVSQITVLNVCEIIPATEKAKLSIAAVPFWKQ